MIGFVVAVLVIDCLVFSLTMSPDPPARARMDHEAAQELQRYVGRWVGAFLCLLNLCAAVVVASFLEASP